MSLGQQHCFCGCSLAWDEPHTRGSPGCEGSAEGRGLGCQPGGHRERGRARWQRSEAFTALQALQRPCAHSVGALEPLQGTAQGSAPAAGAPQAGPGLLQPQGLQNHDVRFKVAPGTREAARCAPCCSCPVPAGWEADGRGSYTEGQCREDTAGVPSGRRGPGAVPWVALARRLSPRVMRPA